MSDGKASTYEVVSVEELHRRALQAARDRHDRALSRYNDLDVRSSLCAARSRPTDG